MSYVITEISPNLVKRCQVCVNGGQNKCNDFDPTKSCYYFDDINDDDPRDDDYDCGAYMHVDDYNKLRNQIKNTHG